MNPQAIEVLNPIEFPEWDNAVGALPGASFFHTQAWAQVLTETYGYPSLYLVRENAGGLTALLPLMEVASWLTGKRGVSLPFTDLAPPLGADAGEFRHLFDTALDLGRKRGWNYLECRGGREWLAEAPPSTSFLHHCLDLGPGESVLHAGLEDSVRRAVRKAERNGVTVEISRTPEAMADFYRLMCLTRRRHGVPPQPYPFFANIQRHVLARNDLGFVALGRDASGQAVAGAVFFHFNGRAIYKFGASDESRQELRANNLVMWRAIRHFVSAGIRDLDFGRTSLGNEGLRKFKLGWGAQESRAEYLRYDLRRSAFVTAKDDAQGWHNRVFRALPLPLSRLAGRLLYRHIA